MARSKAGSCNFNGLPYLHVRVFGKLALTGGLFFVFDCLREGSGSGSLPPQVKKLRSVERCFPVVVVITFCTELREVIVLLILYIICYY